MAGLKELRVRISSIASTKKITSAMKMVAAARLRKAQDSLAKSVEYHQGIQTIAGRLYNQVRKEEKDGGKTVVYPLIMQKRPAPENYLLVVFASDRGLCGSYNSYVLRETMSRINELQKQGKNVKVLCLGKKIGDALKVRKPDLVWDIVIGVGGKGAKYKDAEQLVDPLVKEYLSGGFDVCEMIYTHFNSAINRDVKRRQVMPYEFNLDLDDIKYDNKFNDAFYEYDAAEEKVLNDVVYMLFISEVFQMLLNSQASEQGARMTSMDNATRNASDMIAKLTLKYNRLRQSAITTELVEIISGAEAL
ncbi:MAG: ATP synthase F1 subunit gamma [Alphaproteobacteria bacterium]|nr:ATP synthase F1 subunit gamma [Alphaproteobacteria bacterium]